jgi:hypothetical protein
LIGGKREGNGKETLKIFFFNPFSLFQKEEKEGKRRRESVHFLIAFRFHSL